MTFVRLARFVLPAVAFAAIFSLSDDIAQAGPFPGVTIVVDRSDDSGQSGCSAAPSDCGIRGAIVVANGSPMSIDTIVFDIGTGVPSIQPGSGGAAGAPLPAIAGPVIIDGNTGGADRVNLYGVSANPDSDGLRLVGHSGSTIKSLVAMVGSEWRPASADHAAHNAYFGVVISNATNNFIGVAGFPNVISGNSLYGILLHGADQNFIWANMIGTAADGTTPLGNGQGGIGLGDPDTIGLGADSNNNHIGGEDAGNVIANNGDLDGAGIVVWEGTGNTFSQNAIYDNPGMAIDLFPVGPNTNDDMDPDTGPNNLQNHVPVQSAVLTGDSMHIQGQYNSNPNTTFTIEFFKNGTCSPSGAQSTGLEYFGSTEITTDGNGDATVDATFNDYALEGPYIAYLATHEDGSTSEGQNCTEIDVIPATPTPVPTATLEPTPTATPGPTETPGPTLTPGPSGTPSGKAVQGDTDCDEDVDTVDGLFVLRDVAGFPPSKCIDNGDVDCDEDRDSVDALGILRDVAALPPLQQQEPCADIGTPL